MNLFLMTTLVSAPLWLLLVMVVFLLARWRLSRHHKLLRLFAVAVGGMVYGLLRYSGIIVFADDTSVSYHWFGSSYGDEGYQSICISASVLLGIGIAFLNNRRI